MAANGSGCNNGLPIKSLLKEKFMQTDETKNESQPLPLGAVSGSALEAHSLLNIPLIDIMNEKRRITQLFNLAFECKVGSRDLIFEYQKHGVDTNHESYINVKYKRWNNRLIGHYSSNLNISYSEVSGIEISRVNRNIGCTSNEEKISTLIRKFGWVKNEVIEQRLYQINKEIYQLELEKKKIISMNYVGR